MLAAVAVACGNGSDDSPTAAPTSGGRARQAFTASDLTPDLTSLGFTKGQSERDPAALPGQDAHRTLFQQQAAPQMAARVDVTVLSSDADAIKQWETTAQALRNPPPDLFGGNSTQKDAASTNIGDQSKAYITAKPDTNGTLVWTDVYRFGRVVTVVQVLSRNEPEALKARTVIAEKIREKAK